MIEIVPVSTPAEWESAKAIRFEVFVNEQRVPPEEELDAFDDQARHWLALLDGAPVGTARAVAKPEGWKIGRVAVRQPHRGQGIGLRLMEAVLAAASRAGVREIFLDSQLQAIPFYERLGFHAEGGTFLDAGIPHRRMRRQLVPPL